MHCFAIAKIKNECMLPNCLHRIIGAAEGSKNKDPYAICMVVITLKLLRCGNLSTGSST